MNARRSAVFCYCFFLLLLLPFPVRTWGQNLPFSCELQGAFPPAISLADLETKFGKQNIAALEIDLGEGHTESGTVLFPESTSDRVDILWKDKEEQRNPKSVRLKIDGSSPSRWRGPLGIPPQISLKVLEAFNRKPFRITGFGWDYGGTVVSWAGGAFDQAPTTPCRFLIRLSPSEQGLLTREFRSVLGERNFSSGHPAMQHLNPTAYEFLLRYQ